MISTFLNSPSAKKRAVHVAGATIAGALGLLFYQGLYAPWGRDIEQRSARITQLGRLLTTAEPVLREHQGLVQRTAALTAALASVQRRMPPLGPAAEFIDQATRLAQSLGMEVVQFTSEAPQTAATHSTVELTCRLNGSFASICQYLAVIDQLPQIAKVSRLELDTAGNFDAYPVQMTFQLYYQPELHDTEKERVAL